MSRAKISKSTKSTKLYNKRRNKSTTVPLVSNPSEGADVDKFPSAIPQLGTKFYNKRRNKSTTVPLVSNSSEGADEDHFPSAIPQQYSANSFDMEDRADYETSPMLPNEFSDDDDYLEASDDLETQIIELKRQLKETRTMREVHVKSSGIPTVSLKVLTAEAIEEFKDFVLKSKGDTPNFNRNNFIPASILRRIQHELIATGRIVHDAVIESFSDTDFFALLEYVKEANAGTRAMSTTTLDQVAQSMRFSYDHNERTTSMHKFSEKIYSIKEKLELAKSCDHNEDDNSTSVEEKSLVILIMDALKIAPEKETAIATKVRQYLQKGIKIGKVPNTFDDLSSKLYQLFMHAIEVHDEAITIYGETLKGYTPSVVSYTKPNATRKEDADSAGVDKNQKVLQCNTCGRNHKGNCNFLGGTKDSKLYLPHPDINTESVAWSNSTKGKAWAAKGYSTLPSKKTLGGTLYEPMPTN
jgi:hypothetical protein